MSDELTDDQIYATYFDADGQPVRQGVQLSADEEATFLAYFPETTDRTATTEEIQ